MAATITDVLKRNMLVSIFDRTQNIGVAAGDSDRHYIAIGRSEEWPIETTAPTPYSGVDDALTFRAGIQSMKIAPDVSYVVPRYSWVSGNFYQAWDSRYGSNTEVLPGSVISAPAVPHPFYVLTDDNNVYVCIHQGKTTGGTPRASLYKPVGISADVFSAGADGYFWKFLYNIGAAESRKFLTSTYMPVERIVDDSASGPADADLSVSRLQHRGIQKASIPGQLLGIAIDNPGSGYVTAPSITITGRARIGGESTFTAATASAKVNGGIITDIIMKVDSDDANFTFGRDYLDAAILASGGQGTGATLRAIISTDSGMGGNATLDLNTSAIMFNTQLSGAENNDFQTTNDFRQIGVVRNPLKDSAQYDNFVSTPAATSSTLSAFKKLYVTTGSLSSENITGDQLITQPNNQKAIIDFYDGAGIMHVHQTRETGFAPFDSSDTCTISGGGGTCTPITVTGQPVLRPSEVDRYSGEIIYIDNRTAVSRDPDQTEDIKVVIDL
tara:strand:+ start:16108 stop:17604 length:1497 start_codon:yes stop_codon:yes gene_type:complete